MERCVAKEGITSERISRADKRASRRVNYIGKVLNVVNGDARTFPCYH
jgi:hypothetical protein